VQLSISTNALRSPIRPPVSNDERSRKGLFAPSCFKERDAPKEHKTGGNEVSDEIGHDDHWVYCASRLFNPFNGLRRQRSEPHVLTQSSPLTATNTKRSSDPVSHKTLCRPLLPSGPGGVEQRLVAQDLTSDTVDTNNYTLQILGEIHSLGSSPTGASLTFFPLELLIN